MIKLTTNEEYLRQQLEWVKYRAKALEEIEAKLAVMRELAVFARDNELTAVEARDINAKLQELQREVTEFDDQSRVFWMDCQ